MYGGGECIGAMCDVRGCHIACISCLCCMGVEIVSYVGDLCIWGGVKWQVSGVCVFIKGVFGTYRFINFYYR